MTSTGAAAGFFKGSIDEARIWNVARSQAAIVDTMDEPVAAAANLIGRWALDDGSGTTAANSVVSGPIGSLLPLAGGPAWDTGVSSYVTGLVPGNDALRLTTGDYVSFGAASSALGASRFTVETWFKRDPIQASVATTTGTGARRRAACLDALLSRAKVDRNTPSGCSANRRPTSVAVAYIGGFLFPIIGLPVTPRRGK
jgi:hypothetical protein